MSLFKLGDFLRKLTHMELKKYPKKKQVIHHLNLQQASGIAGIVKYFEVREPAMHLPDELTMRNTINSMGEGRSKSELWLILRGLYGKVFYVFPVNIGILFMRFTFFGRLNKKVIPVKGIPLLLRDDMEWVTKIHKPAIAPVKKSKIEPEQILEVGIDMQGVVEPEKGIKLSFFNFEESFIEIFYQLFNKPVTILLPGAVMIPVIH